MSKEITCQCGICNIINDCLFDGDWKNCQINKDLVYIESLEEENAELKKQLGK